MIWRDLPSAAYVYVIVLGRHWDSVRTHTVSLYPAPFRREFVIVHKYLHESICLCVCVYTYKCVCEYGIQINDGETPGKEKCG